MFRLFRLVALLEGVSTILLFLVAMPLKHWFGFPHLIRPVGWAHGMLFLSYIATMIPGLWDKSIGVIGWLRTVFAAFLPFGTFLNDPFLLRHARAAALAKASAPEPAGYRSPFWPEAISDEGE